MPLLRTCFKPALHGQTHVWHSHEALQICSLPHRSGALKRLSYTSSAPLCIRHAPTPPSQLQQGYTVPVNSESCRETFLTRFPTSQIVFLAHHLLARGFGIYYWFFFSLTLSQIYSGTKAGRCRGVRECACMWVRTGLFVSEKKDTTVTVRVRCALQWTDFVTTFGGFELVWRMRSLRSFTRPMLWPFVLLHSWLCFSRHIKTYNVPTNLWCLSLIHLPLSLKPDCWVGWNGHDIGCNPNP